MQMVEIKSVKNCQTALPYPPTSDRLKDAHMSLPKHLPSYSLGLALAFASVLAYAEAPADIADLVGARASGGETQMQVRGYNLIRSTRVRDQSWTLWWSDVQNQCVAISTDDGRYASIERVPEPNCRPGGLASESRPTPAAPAPVVITLVCYGTGEHSAYISHSGYEWNNQTKRYAPTQRMETGTESFSTGVQVDIRDGAGKIHLSGKLVPPLNSGGTDGWWPLEELRVLPEQITGRYRLNAFNSPSVNIDRRSGMIEVKGMPSFSGKCDVGDWGAGRRF